MFTIIIKAVTTMYKPHPLLDSIDYGLPSIRYKQKKFYKVFKNQILWYDSLEMIYKRNETAKWREFQARYQRRQRIRLLKERQDIWVRETNLETAAGEVWVTPRHCGFEIGKP